MYEDGFVSLKAIWTKTAVTLPETNVTVDRRHPANQLRLVVFPIIYRALYIPGGARFFPATVAPEN